MSDKSYSDSLEHVKKHATTRLRLLRAIALATLAASLFLLAVMRGIQDSRSDDPPSPKSTTSLNAVSLVPRSSESSSALILYDQFQIDKRAWWSWLEDGVSAGLILATSAAFSALKAAVCTTTMNIPCIGTALVAAVTAVVGLINAGGYIYSYSVNKQNGQQSKSSKRSLVETDYGSFIFENGYVSGNFSAPLVAADYTFYSADVVESLLGEVGFKRDGQQNNNLTVYAAGHVTMLVPITTNETLSKRLDGRANLTMPIIMAYLDLGHHSMTLTSGHTLNDLLQEVVNADVGTDMSKRDYDVDWLSYNTEDEDKTYSLSWLNTERNFLVGDALASGIDLFMSEYNVWKVCVAAQSSEADGQDYNRVGLDNIVKGEMYFNTYGGIDGECGDPKDGTDM